MKNKVINLFNKPQVIVQNEGVKYSGLLEKFLAPFVNHFQDVEFYEDIFEFAINAWNFANMKVILPDNECDEILNSVPREEIDFVLLNKMIDYKILNFKEYSNFIVDYDLKETSGDPILSITTQPEEQYLAEMMSKMKEDTTENNFNEGFINRIAIIIKPRQPFLDWCSKLILDEECFDDTNTYLIEENIEDIDTWLSKQYEKIFVAELLAWTPIKEQWPQKRNYKMFKEWFYIDHSTMVYDFEKKPVSKL